MFLSGFNLILLIVLIVGWLALFVLFYFWIRQRDGDSREVHTEAPSQTPLDVFGGAPTRPVEEPVTKVLAPKKAPVLSSHKDEGDGVLLAIEVPKDNESTPLAAELMFASLHGIYRSEGAKVKGAQQRHLSFEIQAKEKSIRFFVWAPKELQGYVEGQIYAQYPEVNVFEVKDYAEPRKLEENLGMAYTELTLNREDIFPIKTFESFDVDPLSGITATLSKLEGSDQVWVQILMRPEGDKWRDKAINYISAVRSGRQGFGKSLMKGLSGLASDVVRVAAGGEASTPEDKKVELAPGVEDALKRVEEKSNKLGFQTKIRIVSFGDTPTAAQQKLDLTVGAFKQFNTTNLNGFMATPIKATVEEILDRYVHRQFKQSGAIMNVTELASIYHLPSKTVVTPHIVWAGAKKGEPPQNLPLADEVDALELTNLGVTDFRGSREKFGIKSKDRYRHIYVIGKSGTGKSTLLQNMALDDVKERRGVGVVDPHGEYVDYVLDRIPSYRVNDVILFDLGDREHPIGFNVLEVANDNQKPIVASGVVGVFKKIFGDSWGPRLEYWLSSAILALLDYPNATLMMIPRLYTDRAFRMQVLEHVKDPVIKARWINEFNTLDQRQVNETIGSILNKVGQFLSSPIIRNIVGQPKGAINMREAMDDGKILLIKLTKGAIGEDNMALLGSLLITQIQLAAMSRSDIEDPEKRRPFFLYVDEFQNFATDSFATILSEARKYKLSLTMANQFMAQLTDTVKDAIMGNVGTLITFRIGGADAAVLVKEFSPVFDEQDLVNLDIFKIYLKLSIDGTTAGAFSATTLPPSASETNNRSKIIALSRERYAKKASFVEGKIAEFNQESEGAPPAPSYNNPNRPGAGTYSSKPKSGFNKPRGNTATGSDKPAPKLDSLKKMISGIEKRRNTNLKPEDKDSLAKNLLDDLKDSSGSMKEALQKARQKKEEDLNKTQQAKPNETLGEGPGQNTDSAQS